MRKARTGPLIPFEAGEALAIHRIVKHGGEDGKVVHATGSGDAPVGVTDRPARTGETVDVSVYGEATVEYGGDVTRGALLRSGADGKAVGAQRRPEIKSALADGAAANTDITVTGIAAGDELIGVVSLDGTSSSDLLSAAAIHAADTIQITSSTASGKLLILWRTPAAAVIGRALVSGVEGDIGQVLLAPGEI